MPNTVTPQPNQNILDIILTSCGTLESGIAFVSANNLGITDTITIAETLNIPNTSTNDTAVVQYLQQNGIIIGTQD